MSCLLIPVKVDCFVFNESVCNGEEHEAKIAPLAQPDYALLQYDNRFLSHDVLRHVDLHAASPATTNMRFMDLGTNKPRLNRQGVYVHWTLPRPYRTAAAKTEEKPLAGLPPGVDVPGGGGSEASVSSDGGYDPTVPSYHDVPPRWLVVRRIFEGTILPETAKAFVPKFRAWVVESDVCRSIDDLDQTVDLQTDVSPYIAPESGENGNIEVNMEAQSEVFIGQCFPAETWGENENTKRVRLNLFNSSNQLFADYQPHNGNVFSMLDRFEYKDSDGTEHCLTAARASYYVIGWQPDISRDLFNPPANQSSKDASVRPSQLRSFNMILEPDGQDSTNDWNKDKTAARTLCHGAMYEVEWHADRKPTNVPADQACAHLMEASPVAVGTTPMDAIMAYVSGHSESLAGDVSDLEKNLLNLQTLLLDRDQGIESQRRAASALSNFNFQRQEGGKKYFLSDPQKDAGTQPVSDLSSPEKTYEPTKEELDNLAIKNEKQRQFDALARSLKSRQWDLFSLWWKLLTDVYASSTLDRYRTSRTHISTSIGELHRRIKSLEEELAQVELDAKKIQTGTSQPFHQAGDPTVLVAGVQSGWPLDFLDPLKVRLRHQIIGAIKDGKPVIPDLPEYLGTIATRVGGPWETDARLLLWEFIALESNTDQTTKPDEPSLYPLYHDLDLRYSSLEDPKTKSAGEVCWRDRWHNTQPWAPLYLEWEVDYVHISYDFWALDDGKRTTAIGEESKLRYLLKTQPIPSKDLKDVRKLSGRVLMLPQPTTSLKHKIMQLFDDTPAPVLKDLLLENCDSMLAQIDQLNLLSAPLAGFTDHLITRQGGTHVKPTYRQPNRDGGGGHFPQPIPEAQKWASAGNFTEADLILMGLETDLTPYGTGVSFTSDQNPFKPVTHGQFSFSKLNIIDKFGQAVHALSPSIHGLKKVLKLYTSEYLRAQQLAGQPTPVISSPSTPAGDEPSQIVPGLPSLVRTEFAQIPPQINQLARINAEFVTLEQGSKGTSSYWKPVSQSVQPVWGWVMINYANCGVQFFTHEGRFFREVRIGGPTGSMADLNWMPDQRGLDPDKDPALKQLNNLLKRLEDKEYLKAFVGMINKAMTHMLPAPGAFAEFSSAIVGQPLALVNMGWSIELAVDAYKSHSSLGGDRMPKRLAPDSGTSEDDLYHFQIKLGDEEKAYDGLVGYWKAQEYPKVGDGLELDTLFTYYSNTSPTKMINHTNYPSFKPYYLDPYQYGSADYEIRHYRELQVFGALIDPFTSIHGYSSILPIRELKLSPWMWQKAFRNMTAFFHMGPLIVTKDLAIDEPGAASAQNSEQDAGPSRAKLPTNSLAQWEWLQPHMAETGVFPGDVQVKSFEVAPVDQKPRFEPNPYTAIEGYLHLKGPRVEKEAGST
ncbi:hypothetical protein BHE90_013975 [Fusarium euwallaceae]|uniref:Uncharacterized protein n=1 Tax=Fusarium euwallaceae TaxID=1147111 RepID=A0A430L789_9HYPO|nr:hypothetical protein BHE90_013975 [Fusarium euwallaceae]